MAGRLADTRGRKATLRWASWLLLLGSVLMMVGPNLSIMVSANMLCAFHCDNTRQVIGRLLIGVACGIATVTGKERLS